MPKNYHKVAHHQMSATPESEVEMVDSEAVACHAPEARFPDSTGHLLPSNDPDSPQNWPLSTKLFVSMAAWLLTASVTFNLTSYTVAIGEIMTEFDVGMPTAILGMSLFLLGVFFAPITTPHSSEKFGRRPVYMASFFVSMLFTLGAGLSTSWTALASCRFYAGVFGGPCIVLIEGTFADVWSAETTNTYYSVLAAAANVGAGLGPIVLGFIFPATSWRWTQYVSLMIMLAAFLFAIGMPETYPRQIMRTRARRAGQSPNLPEAQSGTTFKEMAKITLIEPAIMLVSEPIVIMSSLLLGANFGFLFQWFITVPVALSSTYEFSIQEVGLAFISAIVGTVLALTMSVLLDTYFHRQNGHKDAERRRLGQLPSIEHRLFPAMLGAPLMIASLFWIANTATPTISAIVPIAGTAVYVWGSMSVIVGIVSYLFDAYPPKNTLSALTAAACFRVSMAAVIPLIVIPAFEQITPKWTLSAFGFVIVGLLPVPFVLYFFGERMRNRSRYRHQPELKESLQLS